MSIPRNIFPQLIELVTLGGCKKATKYFSPTETAKATSPRKRDKRLKSQTVVITFGTPNYEEREFIKKAKKVGEPFPIRKIQLKYFPAK